jgi:hypothetical protein
MALISLAVQAENATEPTRVDITPRLILMWEKAHRNRSGSQLDNSAVRFEYLYEIAWLALDKPGGDFDAWCKTTDVCFASDKPNTAEQAALDPTQPDQPTGD